ncbi:HTH-type transcriptional activator HxlR [Streptomyces netropsis]|uniref:DNA-binding HxlR family transcriptional regulator n=1 Tax=Streptomyces syringium TaxID=76729 RepID=A0ABS4YAF6_9ACTN|nr:helix-turn-helix domain-containing protein [Streptomyces syringium]MBP2405772.1 DNA-binding HxlR family transcriptional regulator [Streptomyces syringium]SPE64315.1 HTH-type transcriptional activator HxlR [Streptomyces netropsis]
MATSARRGPYFCGIDAAMDVVAGKWKSLILWELHEHGTRRFAELRRGLPGVSEKMLIQHLREMEADGLVHREVYREVPPKVEYSLTEHGVSLNAALASLGEWGTERMRRIGAEKVSVNDAGTTGHRASA